MLNKCLISLLLPLCVFASIETKEDKEHFYAFVDLYEKNASLVASNARHEIPKKLHFIWLGVAEMPIPAKECLKYWIQAHPDWEVNLWTDYQHRAPVANIQMRSIESMHSNLPVEYNNVCNIAEQSLLLRYAVLLKYGGIYLDCDVKCFKNIEAIIKGAEFVTTYDINPSPILSSSVYASPYFIAARPSHPIILSAMEKTLDRWQEVHASFPYDDEESKVYRAKYLTYTPLTQAIMCSAKDLDLVIPRAMWANYGRHLALQTWMSAYASLPQDVRRKIGFFDSQLNKQIIYPCLMVVLSVLTLIALKITRRKKTHILKN